MKINENLVIYTTIQSWDQNWEMGANIGKNGYYSPYLTCLNPLLTNFEADASGWLIDTLYINLKIMIEAKGLWIGLTDEIIQFRKEEISDIPIEDYEIIIELIEQAIELGFFREHYDKSK